MTETSSDPRFDQPPSRRGTRSNKWDRYRGTDILPFWVADMDFETAPAVREAVAARVEHGIYGYSKADDAMTQIAMDWVQQNYAWATEAEWYQWLPGVVPGFNLACMATGAPGEGVLVPVPVYHPFLSAPSNARRRSVFTQLSRTHTEWQMDFDAMRRDLVAAHVPTRLMLQCNPQNPTGRVYRRSELEQLAAFVLEHNLVVCSDEIHCGLTLTTEQPHIPLAALDPEIAHRTITLMAATKTWNIPGLGCAFAIIPDPELRIRFHDAMNGLVPSVGPLALEATAAALQDRSDWLPSLLEYLRSNHALLQATVAQLPGVHSTPVEGTCLAWLDVRDLHLKDPAAHCETHGIGLSDGADFGGPGFLRFNFGCSREVLQEGLSRLRSALG